jgi:hypothetical protein
MINLNLEIAEVEALLKHVGQGAYAEVAGLVAKIHGQATAQVQAIQSKSVVSTQQDVSKEPDTSLS